jgi:serine/threonine protein kinase
MDRHRNLTVENSQRGTRGLRHARRLRQAMDEAVVMYYAMELLRIVEELHRCHIIHTDIKPDNLVVRDSRPQGGWEAYGAKAEPGLTLIDFGRVVDLALLPQGTMLQVPIGCSCSYWTLLPQGTMLQVPSLQPIGCSCSYLARGMIYSILVCSRTYDPYPSAGRHGRRAMRR